MKKALLVALILVLIYLQGRLWIGHNSFSEVSSLRAEIQELEAEVRTQREINRRLQSQVDSLREGEHSDTMEEQIRERLGLIREGETFFQFMRD